MMTYEQIKQAAIELGGMQAELKRRAMLFDVVNKERIAKEEGKPFDFYYHYDFDNWIGVKRRRDEAEARLRVGSVIKVHGFVMLAGLEDGAYYRVASISWPKGWFYYDLAFGRRGRRVQIRHMQHHVDCWIRDATEDLNYIEVIYATPDVPEAARQ